MQFLDRIYNQLNIDWKLKSSNIYNDFYYIIWFKLYFVEYNCYFLYSVRDVSENFSASTMSYKIK